MAGTPRWKVFVVAHERVVPEFLHVDPDWRPDNWAVINVRAKPLRETAGLPVIRQEDLPAYRPLGAHWAESEAIYNLYRSGLHQDLDFIGFLHYDVELRLARRTGFLPRRRTDVTQRVEAHLAGRHRAHVSFATFGTREDYDQRILADISRPETLVGDGVNCYDYILADYNEYFGETKTRDDFFAARQINLCSLFLIDVPAFERMMAFFAWVVDSRKLDVFDTLHRHRLQGGLAERYFGLYLAFNSPGLLDLSLKHHDLKARS